MTDTERREAGSLPYRPCVGIMLLDRRGQVWVGRRADHGGPTDAEGPGTWWQMPQGGLDDGEAPEAAARRELYEETGIRSVSVLARTRGWLHYDLPPELLGVAWQGRYCGQKQIWFAMRFEGAESEVDLGPREGHDAEFDAWRWAEPAELPELIVPFKRAVYEAVLAEFAPLLKPDVKD